ncbi:hypothetical protein SAMN05421504_11599 [Amycolatopsis xylanica]|uniref:Uncharacterized protein n=1 Tax=Amycolatopsis xylanica TaxID=589385 RepID=A0A1H3SST6_9PSEU|nr:hypothetical protein [Amycolatopsis xylanica]SDZ41032.1 hypothetical protein SAMN05421504_11599 [Amycolatopsis xylanica]
MSTSWEERLIARLSGSQVWVSLRASRLPRERVDEIVARLGKAVIRECSDDTDTLLLVGEPGTRPARSARTRPSHTYAVARRWLYLVLVVGCVTSLIRRDELPMMIALGIAAAVALTLILRGTLGTTQAELLAREFTGKYTVTVVLPLHQMSRELRHQVAAAYGYEARGPVRKRRSGNEQVFQRVNPGNR